LTTLADSPDVGSARAYPFGAISPWHVNFDRQLPRFVAELISLGVNAMGLLQPTTIEAFSPLLVLEVRKGPGI